MLTFHDDKDVIFVVFCISLMLIVVKNSVGHQGFADYKKYKAALVKLPVFYCN